MTRTFKPLVQLLLTGTALTSPLTAGAGELPYGASAVHGAVSIATPQAGQMTIQQTTPSAIVNWQGFSIGQGNRVDIVQPSASSAILNRVTGSTPSTIAGQLNANGQVYLVNPNGIAITRTGTVNAGAFVASTLDTSDQDFKAGRRVFRGTGQSATVSNQGSITVQQGGYAALLGGRVENTGLISVPLGKVGLGAGEQATLDFTGDGFLQVAVPSRKDGSDAALIRHSGTIKAAGGTVVMQAATARDTARNAINLSGIVEARSVSGRSGAVVLGGGEGGTVTVSGRVDTSARGAGPRRDGTVRTAAKPVRGGDITVTGDAIRLAGATLKADGTAGGGRIQVGGGFQGQGPLQRATTTNVDAATTLSADAGRTGDGGSVVLWSDQFTAFAGRISATGGTQGGNGGQAEVSGKAQLAYTGTTVLTADHGTFGTLLLDPYNVTISSAADANQTGFAATGNDSVINATTLQNALRTANVTVSTGGAGSPGTQAGDITVAAPVTWGTGAGGTRTTLTLNAYRSIAVNANLTVSGSGDLALNTNQGGTGGALTFGPGASASFTGTVAVPTDRSLVIDTQPYTILTSTAQVSTFLSTEANATGLFALAGNIDLSTIPVPFTRPLNTTASGTDVVFRGTLNGLGHTINGVNIVSSNQYVGAFGRVSGATIANLNLTNVNIRSTYAGTGPSAVGGLVGEAANATIVGVTVSGTVATATANTSSFNQTGGLAGVSSGTVTRSVANVAVTGGGGTGTSATGGLLGVNNGTVSQSFATGAVGANSVPSFNDVGGLIGQNNGAVTQAYATGAVTGGTSSNSGPAGLTGVGSFTGGLIGFSGSSSIDQVYATGVVRGGNGPASNSYTGGLIGYGTGSTARAYATGAVTGGSSSNAYTGGLTGYLTGSVTQSYAVGAVTAGTGAAISTGGLFGFANGTGVTASFWDTQTTGQGQAAGSTPGLAGATGLTTAQFQDTAGFVTLASGQGWNFQTTWAQPSAGFYPQLYSIAPVIAVTAASPSRVYGDANPALTGTVAGGPGTYVFGVPGTAAPDAATLLTTSATPTTNAGTAAIAPVAGPVTLGGTSYRVTGTSGTLTVSPRPLVITADPQSRVYGDSNPTLTYQTNTGGLVNGDQLAGALATAATPQSGVGPYTINQGTLAASSNYATTYQTANLTVVPRPLTITANPQSRVYGDSNPALTYQTNTGGLVNGDQLAGALATAATPQSGVGPYTINQGTLAASSNYATTYQTANLTVVPRPLTITADPQTRRVGDPNPDLTYQVGGRGLVNDDRLSGALATDATPQSAAGAYPITQGTLAASPNYAVTYQGADLTVAPPLVTKPEQASAIANATVTPNVVTVLPNLTAPSLTLASTIDLAGPQQSITLGGGGPTLGVGQSSDGVRGGSGSGTVASANRTLSSINSATRSLESRLANCDSQPSTLGGYQPCVSNALEGFADELNLQVQQLPPAFRNIPAVIREAARQVRTARTVTEARAAVRVAVAAVRKAISLLRADEPAVARIQQRQGQAIATALRAADARLSKAVGL